MTSPTPPEGDDAYEAWVKSLSPDEFAAHLADTLHSPEPVSTEELRAAPRALRDGDAVAFLPTPPAPESGDDA